MIAPIGKSTPLPVPPSKTSSPIKPTLETLAGNTERAKKIQAAVEKAYGIIAEGHRVKLDRSIFDLYVQTYAHIADKVQGEARWIEAAAKKGQTIDPQIIDAHQKLKKLVELMKDKVSFVHKAISSHAAGKPAGSEPKTGEVSSPNQASRPEAPFLRKGETALHWAVRNHNHSLALQLRLMGHPLFATDNQGLTPLDEAVLQEDQEMVKILLFGDIYADPKKKTTFINQLQNAQQKLTALAQIDLKELSPVCRAAYEGNVEELETANGLDKPDTNGLTPLHFALLGGNPKAIQYIAGTYSSLNHTTKKGHSYLDYAILSGNLAIYEGFKAFGVPFKLDAPDQQFAFLIASGLLQQQITREAHRKDPIAVNFGDIFGGIVNGIQLGCQGIGAFGVDIAQGRPENIPDWKPWFQQKVFNFSAGANPTMQQFNNMVGFGQLQQQKLLPRIAGEALRAFNAGLMIYGIGHWAAAKLNIIDEETAKKYVWTGASAFIDSKLGTGSAEILWKGFAIFKVAGVLKAVLPKIGSYWNAYKSRPSTVLKRAALDVFNLGSQSFFAYQAFNPAVPIPTGP